MADGTQIQWADATWSPTTGCDKVSDGCDHCYALTMAKRLKAMGQAKYQRDGDPRTSGPGFGLTVHPDMVNLPIRWRKPRRIFVNSMSDLFHADVPEPWLADIFAVMAAAPQHTYQILTKRHARMRAVLSKPGFAEQVKDRALGKGMPADRWAWPLPQVWLGVSVENQHWADIRIPALLDTPAAVRWISAEPLLGPVDLTYVAGINALERDWVGGPSGGTGAPHPFIDWCVVGGESGPGARPLDLDCARRIVADCQQAGVAVFMKQLGTRQGGKDHHDIDAFPPDLRVREWPVALDGAA